MMEKEINKEPEIKAEEREDFSLADPGLRPDVVSSSEDKTESKNGNVQYVIKVSAEKARKIDIICAILGEKKRKFIEEGIDYMLEKYTDLVAHIPPCK